MRKQHKQHTYLYIYIYIFFCIYIYIYIYINMILQQQQQQQQQPQPPQLSRVWALLQGPCTLNDPPTLGAYTFASQLSALKARSWFFSLPCQNRPQRGGPSGVPGWEAQCTRVRNETRRTLPGGCWSTSSCRLFRTILSRQMAF